MALALALSLLIGAALGLLGGGGSILTVPVLTFALHMDPKTAIATSLLIVAVTSLAALIPHALAGRVSFKVGFGFGAAGMAGAYAGGRLAALIPGELLLGGFALMMVATGVAMLRGSRADEARSEKRPPAGGQRMLHIVLHGLVVGAVTGLVGAGGGFLIVPSLVLLGGMGMKQAVATSLLVIAMKSFAGFAGYAGHVHVDLALVLPIVGVAVLGSVLGVVWSKKIAPGALRQGFAWFVLVMAALAVKQALPPSLRETAAYRAVFVGRWPFWAGGAAIASVVIGLLLLENKQLGVSTGCAELCEMPKNPGLRASWRPRFLVGIVLGGVVASLFSGARPTLTMGALDGLVGASQPLKLLVLLGGGVLVGLGARLAGGCTSGHGIVGTALGARASWVATALFMLGGFATTHLFLVGG